MEWLTKVGTMACPKASAAPRAGQFPIIDYTNPQNWFNQFMMEARAICSGRSRPAKAQDLAVEPDPSKAVVGGGYVGSDSCKECHKRQYEAYMKFSRKSTAFAAVERMKKDLSEEELQGCYRCHATGYGKPTGFESPERTPHLKNVGCEACHGPGRLHTQTMEMAHIVKTVTIDVCEKCHKSDLVKSFRYKSVIYAGAH